MRSGGSALWKGGVDYGGSSGIGLAAAKALIEAGAYVVVVTGRRQTELDRAKQLLGKNATAVLGSADKCD